MVSNVLTQRAPTPAPEGRRRNQPRNRLLAWLVGVAVLVLVIALVVLKVDRIDEGQDEEPHPGVISADQADSP